MLIRILKTATAASCNLGIKTREYTAGNTEEIFDNLAQVFISQGWGVKVEDVIIKEPTPIEVIKPMEEKAVEKAPENKSVEKAPENKASKTNKKNINFKNK